MLLKTIKRAVPSRQGFPSLGWLTQAVNGGFVPGGAYLLSGHPGGNKTTLGVQIATDMAGASKKILMLLNEQSPAELCSVFARVSGSRGMKVPRTVQENVAVEQFDSPADLLHILRRKLPSYYPDTELVVVDSLQGGGLASTATSGYRQYYDFLDEAKANGLTTLTLAHVTKSGKIAGPKTLEHKVDVCMVLRKAASLRHLFIPKNRFGPEVTEPITLLNTAEGLKPSPYSNGATASVLGYIGQGDELLEVQVEVSLPKLGGRAELNAPFLHGKRVKQIITTLRKLPDLNLNDVCYAINALVPDGHGYSTAIDLPLAMAVLSAYLQQPIPQNALFIGGLDLRRNVRPPTASLIKSLSQMLDGGSQPFIRDVYVSSAAAGMLSDSVADHDSHALGHARINGIRTLDELLQVIWPDVVQSPPSLN